MVIANEDNAESSIYSAQPNTDQSSTEIKASDLIGGWNATEKDGSPTNKDNFMILYIPDSSQLYLRNDYTTENFDYSGKTPRPVNYFEHYNYQINTSGLGDFNIDMSLVDNSYQNEVEIKFTDQDTIDYIADGRDYTLSRISGDKAKAMLGIGKNK